MTVRTLAVRRRGRSKVEDLTMKDGTQYRIYLDKGDGYYCSVDPLGSGTLHCPTLPAIREDITKAHYALIETTFELRIEVSGLTQNHWRDSSRYFDFEHFCFTPVWTSVSGEKIVRQEARFGPPGSDPKAPMSLSTRDGVRWQNEPSGPDDVVSRQHNLTSGWGFFHIPYTWETWQALMKLKHRIKGFRTQLNSIFETPASLSEFLRMRLPIFEAAVDMGMPEEASNDGKE